MFDLGPWHDLFAMLGGASAALVGLLFVAASLHAQTLAKTENRHIRALAGHALLSFIVLLLLSICMLIPGQTPLRLGLQLLGLGGVVLIWTGLLVRAVRRASGPQGPRNREWLRTYAVSVLVACGLAATGMGQIAGTNILGWLPGLVMALLLMAILTSWDLLLRIPAGRNLD
jgi:hypothetical protein